MSFYLDTNSVSDWNDGLLGLMYHAVEAPPLLHGLRGLYVEPALLDEQLARSPGRRAPPSSRFPIGCAARPPGRNVAVTFDDAFQSVLDHALPVLQKRGVTSVTYVVAHEIGGTNRWDEGRGQLRPLMDRAALLDWQAAGQEIGSHGLSHVALADVSARARARGNLRQPENSRGPRRPAGPAFLLSLRQLQPSRARPRRGGRLRNRHHRAARPQRARRRSLYAAAPPRLARETVARRAEKPARCIRSAARPAAPVE